MTAKALRCVGRRAYTYIPRPTRWMSCRSTLESRSRPSHGEAEESRDTPNRRLPASTTPQQRLAGLRCGELTHYSTQHRRQRLNKRHKPLRQRRPQLPAEIRRYTPRLLAEVLAAKLHTAFQNITNAPKTPTSPALESTPTSRHRRRSTP
jgi:hypothetical protein